MVCKSLSASSCPLQAMFQGDTNYGNYVSVKLAMHGNFKWPVTSEGSTIDLFAIINTTFLE